MIGNSDIHTPMPNFEHGKHRPITLVFARNATAEDIREALNERRTAVYNDEYVIGEEKYLKELFENALDISMKKNDNNTVQITFKNNSDLTFKLKKTSHDANLVYFREYTIIPNGIHLITVRLENGVKGGDINFSVENFLVEPNKGMKYTVKIQN
jgi:hypothetical protein